MAPTLSPRSLASPGGIPHFAEDVLAGHPDRLADGIAEVLVDRAVAHDPDALVGVEVAVHRSVVFITGRIASGAPGQPLPLDLDELVRDVYEAAGYKDHWTLLPRVTADLDLGPLADDERGIRCFSDDQNLVAGYAAAEPRTGRLPPAAWVARRLKEVLRDVRNALPTALGPDGKVWVHFTERAGEFQWRACNISLQHQKEAGYELLYGRLLPALRREMEELDRVLPGLRGTWNSELFHLNGAGDFSCGGPLGDNGLSGKKLVVDHYGPGIPIGGGALCGKDPHKVDRAGALRARQLAVRLVRHTGEREALVYLGYLPGAPTPALLSARLGTEWLDEATLRGLLPVPDLSLAGTFRELELAHVRWGPVSSEGYFGRSRAWER